MAEAVVAKKETSTKTIRAKSSVLEDLKAIQQNVKAFKPGDLVVPILSLIVLGLLTAFVYVPMVSQAIKYNQESKADDAKIASLGRLETTLDSVDLSTLQQDLADSREVIPFSLQVSDFILNVDKLARAKNLTFKEVLAGDVTVRAVGEKRGTDPVVKGVSGPLKYVGQLSDITEFLDSLQTASTYIISADDIKLKRSAEGGTWEVALAVTGYYLNQNALAKPDIYKPFSSYTQYNSIIDVFKAKAVTK